MLKGMARREEVDNTERKREREKKRSSIFEWPSVGIDGVGF